MAAMIVLMVALLVMGGHHGFGGSHEANAPKAQAEHAHLRDNAKHDDKGQ